MSDDQIWQQLNSFVDKEGKKLAPLLFVKEKDFYWVFGWYEIWPGKQVTTVKQPLRDSREFGSPRAALAWCIAEKMGQVQLSQDIMRLDQDQRRIRDDLTAMQNMRSNDPIRQEIMTIKFDNRKRSLQIAQDKLNKCIGLAKYFQTRGFNNEIERTKRSSTIRTSR